MSSNQENASFWATFAKKRGEENVLSDADAFALGYAPGTTIVTTKHVHLEQHQPAEVIRTVVREPAATSAMPKETPYAPQDITADLDTRIKLGTFQGRPCLWVVKENKWHPIFIAKFRARIIQHLYDRRGHADERIFRVRDLAKGLGTGVSGLFGTL